MIKSRRLEWAGNVARMAQGGSAFRILTGKPTVKKPLGMSRPRWEDNIELEIGVNTRNWVVPLRMGIVGEPL